MISRVGAWSGRACVVGIGVALMGVGTVGQQVGRVPLEVRIPSAPVQAVALGRTHLAWEVHLTSFGTAPATLDRLDVLDDTGAVIGTWEGTPLRQRVTVIGQPAAPGAPITLAPGARAVVFLWVTLDAGRVAPSSLIHRVTAHGTEGVETIVSASIRVRSGEAPRLRAPVTGGPWVAVRGPSPASGHRLSLVAFDGTVRVPQRFAVDWLRLGEDGRPFRNEGLDVNDWYSYGAPVMAVANGTVALVRDGVADTTPRTPAPMTISATEAPGNVVVLDLGGGRFATYAHLKAGSVVVKAGDSVRAGQLLAQIGNSGNALGPHLHFQVSDAVEPLGGEGLPFSMDHFELTGRIPGLGPMLAGTPWTPQANQPARAVTGEMPLENMVVRFEG
jgi:murein DD-endopeptidase